MKKLLYLFSSTTLGILLSFLIHALLEVIALKIYTPTVSWDIWIQFHDNVSIALSVAGALGGFFIGKYWIRNYPLWSYVGFKFYKHFHKK